MKGQCLCQVAAVHSLGSALACALCVLLPAELALSANTSQGALVPSRLLPGGETGPHTERGVQQLRLSQPSSSSTWRWDTWTESQPWRRGRQPPSPPGETRACGVSPARCSQRCPLPAALPRSAPELRRPLPLPLPAGPGPRPPHRSLRAALPRSARPPAGARPRPGPARCSTRRRRPSPRPAPSSERQRGLAAR